VGIQVARALLAAFTLPFGAAQQPAPAGAKESSRDEDGGAVTRSRFADNVDRLEGKLGSSHRIERSAPEGIRTGDTRGG
jgi:hypothetical protein